MRKILICVLSAGLLSATAGAQAVPGQADDQATVWYLHHAGWAVRLGDALLVFDYQESDLGWKTSLTTLRAISRTDSSDPDRDQRSRRVRFRDTRPR